MRRRIFLAQAAAFATLPAFSANAAPPDIALFDAAVYLVSTDTTRFPRLSPGSPLGGVEPAGTTRPGVSVQTGRARPVPTAEAVLQWMRDQNVDRIAAVQSEQDYGYSNDYLLLSADLYPDQMSPVVIIDANQPDAPARLRSLISGKGVAAVRLTGTTAPNGDSPWLASDQALNIWQVAADTGIALDLMYLPPMHSNAALAAIATAAAKFPTVRVVLDHFGWPAVHGAPGFGVTEKFAAVARHPNIYLKFTSVNLDVLEAAKIPADRFLAHAVSVLGPERLMWGSDFGSTPGTYADLVARGRAAASLLSAADQQKVMHDNGKGFFIRGGLPT